MYIGMPGFVGGRITLASPLANCFTANPPGTRGLSVFGDRLYAHGNFSSIAGANRQSLAAFPVVEYFGGNGFE